MNVGGLGTDSPHANGLHLQSAAGVLTDSSLHGPPLGPGFMSLIG